MNVSGVGSAPVIPDALPPLRTLPASLPEIFADTASLVFPELADPLVRNVLDNIEQARNPPDAEPIIHAAVLAAAQGHGHEAIHLLHELAVSNPEAVNGILRDPVLHPIHDMVRAVLQRVTVEAKLSAEKVLAVAAPHQSSAPQIFTAANRFFETGQYINYVRAQALGLAVISAGAAVRNVRRPLALQATVLKVWQRAPLLILFAAWLVTGLLGWAASRGAAGIAFDMWGIGFLALVGAQFCITIRNARLRPKRLASPAPQIPPVER